MLLYDILISTYKGEVMKKAVVLFISLGFIYAVADSSSINVNQDRYIKNSNSVKRVQSNANTYIELRGNRGSGSAGGSQVTANENTNLNLVNKSDVKQSAVGMQVKASGSKVTVNKNTNLNLVDKSKVEQSLVGMGVKASKNSDVQANENTNLNLVNKSNIKRSVVGMGVSASESKVKANKNINLNLVDQSDVEGSTVGMEIDAK